jgi:hypothetical protein
LRDATWFPPFQKDSHTQNKATCNQLCSVVCILGTPTTSRKKWAFSSEEAIISANFPFRPGQDFEARRINTTSLQKGTYFRFYMQAGGYFSAKARAEPRGVMSQSGKRVP